MIRRLLLGSLAAVAATAASAADLPSRRAPPVYVAPAIPVFTWSGGYFGINGGYAFDSNKRYSFAGAGAPGGFQTKDDGFTGGAQIGYNYELGSGVGIPGLSFVPGFAGSGGIVFGVEADAAYTDLKSSTTIGGAVVGARTDYVGTARGRLGLAFDTLLVYGTGGFAYGGVRDSVTFRGFTAGSDKIRTGYAYGGGVEYAIPTSSFVNIFKSSAVTLKAEFIHYDLGTDTFTGGGVTSRVKTEGNIARAGLNYKLNFMQAVPVVARY